MNFPGQWIQVETIILSEVTQKQNDMHVCTHLQWTVIIKYRISTLYSIEPKKLNKKKSPNEHCWISFKRGIKQSEEADGRKRENWMGEWISKGKVVGESGKGLLRHREGPRARKMNWNLQLAEVGGGGIFDICQRPWMGGQQRVYGGDISGDA